MIRLTPLSKALIRAACIDAYPLEASGLLLGAELGKHTLVSAVLPIAQADIRVRDKTGASVGIETSYHLVEPELEDWIVGGFHSHPDDSVHMSEGDKSDPITNGLEIVVGITKGTRKWRVKMGAYEERDGKWYRAQLCY